jgi:large subunit ribosomal protein L10
MRLEEKNVIIDSLKEQIGKYNHFYLADTSELNAGDTSTLRRMCFEREIELVVVKNTLLRKALEKFEGVYDELFPILNNSTSIMFCNNSNTPAKLIKDFRKNKNKPLLKGAYVEESIYLGDDKLDLLLRLKSKEELIADVILLLRSPVTNLLSALQSGGNKLAGVVKALAERE